MNHSLRRWRLLLKLAALLLGSGSAFFASAGDPSGVPVPASAPEPAPVAAPPLMVRSSVYAAHGVVCANHPLASQAGLKVLEAGGNAFDAAVVAAAIMNVTEPMMTGIGGDMFAIAWVEGEQRLVGINGSGRSGSRFTAEALLGTGVKEMPKAGAATITVPGALAGWASLLERYGTLTLAQALEPAARIAEEGFMVPENAAYFWGFMSADLRNDGARQSLLLPGGKAPKKGEWYANPALAKTFREIGQHGATWLYGGDLGRRLAEFLEREGGFITLDDLASHASTWVEPIAVPFGDFKLWEMPPNGQGIAALEMIRILDTAEFRSLPHNSAEYLHRLIEAKKLAYADLQTAVGDPEWMRVQPAQLLDETFIARRRAAVDLTRAQALVQPDEALLASDTTYLTAADRHGNMVSFINSVCSGFGSGLAVPGTGFVLQNRGVGFTLDPKRVNTVAPGRRPFHTIIPGFITRRDAAGQDRPWASVGIMGGDNQPQAHVQAFLNLVHFNMSAQEAIDAPRFRHLTGLSVLLENRIAPEVGGELALRGHELSKKPHRACELFGTGHIIRRVERGYEAGSDTRSDGLPAGY